MAQFYWNDDYWNPNYWGSEYWAAQTFAGLYDQTLNVESVFLVTSAQEHVPPDSPSGYYQTGRASILIVDISLHEYIPASSGEFGQTGLATIGFSADGVQLFFEAEVQVADGGLVITPDSLQFWIASGLEVEFLQVGTLSASFARQSLQDWEDAFNGPQAYCLMPFIRGITDANPVVFSLTMTPSLPSAPEYFYLKFMCSAHEWVEDAGDAGAPVGVELVWDDDDTRFVSLLHGQDYVIIQQHVEPAYTKLYDALISGEVRFKVRGFERFAGYSLAQQFNSDSAIRLRAYY